MSDYIAKAAILLASGVFAWWLGGIQYPGQPLSQSIGTIIFVNQAKILIQDPEKNEQKEEKSLKG